MFFRNFPRFGLIALRIASNSFDCVDCLTYFAKRKETASDWKPFGETGLLHNYGAATSEVCCTSFTEPSAVADNVALFCNCKLTLRTAKIVLETLRRACHLEGILKLPPSVNQRCARRIWSA